jgi:hypothetical protein
VIGTVLPDRSQVAVNVFPPGQVMAGCTNVLCT